MVLEPLSQSESHSGHLKIRQNVPSHRSIQILFSKQVYFLKSVTLLRKIALYATS